MFYIKKIILLQLFIICITANKVYAVETVVRIAFDPNLPPYQFIDEGDYVGIHIDAMNEIAKNNNFIVKYIPIDGRSNCFKALESGKVDAVLGAENGRYASSDVYYTDNLSQSYICIIASREKAGSIQNMFSIDNYSAVVEDGTVRYSYIRNMRNLKYTVVPNQIHAFELLTGESVDLLIGVKHSILYQLDKSKLDNDYVIINNYVTPIEYGIAVKKRPDDLLDKLNSGIRQLRISGEYEVIYDKWINEDKYAVRELIGKVIKIAALIFITACLLYTSPSPRDCS